MKRIILIIAIVFASSLNTQATTPTSKGEVFVDMCMSDAMRRADIDLANGTITNAQYFGRVRYYRSQCAFGY